MAIRVNIYVPTDGTNLDRIFADLLNRCIDDAQAGPSSDAYSRMAMQSLVLARLAGFLAGHVALNEDPMGKLMEATVLGYGEADMSVRGHDHDHGHQHSHQHQHQHGSGQKPAQLM